MLHPLLTPAHAAVIAGLALLLGRRTPLDLGRPMIVFAPASALALMIAMWIGIGELPPALLHSLALVLGVMVALDYRLPRPVVGGLCGLAALGIGLDSGLDPGGSQNLVFTWLGTWIGMNALVVYLAVCVSHGTQRQWSRVAIRVAGSWIVAIALMMLAYVLR